MFFSEIFARPLYFRLWPPIVRRQSGPIVMLRALIDVPRWLFLGLLIYAPWAYGCTTAGTVTIFEFWAAVILVLWLAGCAIRRLRPFVPRVVFFCSGWLLLQGWWMTGNAHFRLNPESQMFVPVRSWLSFLPGTVDQASSEIAMLRVTILLGIVCFSCDLSARPEWRSRVWWVMGITGVSLTLFGLLQSASSHPILFRGIADQAVPFFATYYYHGNAGSFINLALPIIFGFAVLAIRQPSAHLERAIWVTGAFICITAAFVNVSRSAMVVTVILCTVLFAWQLFGSKPRAYRLPLRLKLLYSLVAILALACLIGFSGWERPLQKWAIFESQLNSANQRWLTNQVCLRMIPDAGLWGFGPGTFSGAFPHYSGFLGNAIPGIWRYAHNDYLQSLIDWGWTGALAWSVLLFSGIENLIAAWRGNKRRRNSPDGILLFTTGVALAGIVLHALVDFPLQIASLQLYVATYLGIAWASDIWMRDRTVERSAGVSQSRNSPNIATAQSTESQAADITA